jgi:hypothetical protein
VKNPKNSDQSTPCATLYDATAAEMMQPQKTNPNDEMAMITTSTVWLMFHKYSKVHNKTGGARSGA